VRLATLRLARAAVAHAAACAPCARLGAHAAPCAAAARGALSDPEPFVRAVALESLAAAASARPDGGGRASAGADGEARASARAAGEALAAALADSEAVVRRAAADALAALLSCAPLRAPLLAGLASGGGGAGREGGAWAAAVRALVRDPDWEVGIRGVDLLRALAGVHRGASRAGGVAETGRGEEEAGAQWSSARLFWAADGGNVLGAALDEGDRPARLAAAQLLLQMARTPPCDPCATLLRCT